MSTSDFSPKQFEGLSIMEVLKKGVNRSWVGFYTVEMGLLT